MVVFGVQVYAVYSTVYTGLKKYCLARNAFYFCFPGFVQKDQPGILVVAVGLGIPLQVLYTLQRINCCPGLLIYLVTAAAV